MGIRIHNPAFPASILQCCGSGIRDWVPFWPQDPGSGMGESQHPDPGSGMNNTDIFFRAYKPFFCFFWVKIHQFFEDPCKGDSSDPGSGMEKVWSGINIPDPPHWYFMCFFLLQIIKLVDVSYGGENGFNQAIELSAESLSNVKFIQEKKLIGRYFDEISQVSDF